MNESPKPSKLGVFLELLTGGVLGVVLLAMIWMVLVTLVPTMPRVMSVEAEASLMIGLLFASLILVSAVALLHTRR